MIQITDQKIVIVGILVLMLIALIIDGEFGERVFGLLFGGLALILGYFFRKAGEKPTPSFP